MPHFLLQLNFAHYENLTMQYTVIFFSCKNKKEKISRKIKIFSLFLLKTLILATRKNRLAGGSNEYPQSMFWNKIRKRGIPLLTPVLLYKSKP